MGRKATPEKVKQEIAERKATPAITRHPGAKGHSRQTVDAALRAVAETYGNVSAASRLLESRGKYVAKDTIRRWVHGEYAGRFMELRDEMTAQQEHKLARDMLDVAGRTIPAQQAAIDKSLERLLAGEESDPAKAAVNLARVGQINVDKMLALTGRPSEVRESHDVEALLRGLVAVGVLKAPEPPPKQIDATAEEEDAA